jgi:hypothetical protein
VITSDTTAPPISPRSPDPLGMMMPPVGKASRCDSRNDWIEIFSCPPRNEPPVRPWQRDLRHTAPRAVTSGGRGGVTPARLFHAGPTATTTTPSILMRKAIVSSLDGGASSMVRLNAAISSCAADLGQSVAFSAQTGIPSDVSALRSDLRSGSRQISRFCEPHCFEDKRWLAIDLKGKNLPRTGRVWSRGMFAG